MSTLPLETPPVPEAAPRPPASASPAGVAGLPFWGGLAFVLLAGAVFHSPSIGAQFMLDDYLHSSMLHGTFPVARHPLDLYNFVDDGDRAVLLERGLIPWWSHPQLTIKFFRPLSSALLWADHMVLGEGALPRHLHSLLWWALAVSAAALFFRRVFAPRVGWIATFAYALAPCHSMPLAWVANREALVSLAFGTGALVAYLRWRESRGLGHAALAALLFGGALLAGEYGLSFAGYVLAFELLQRRERLLRRAVGVLPFVVPAAAYLALRTTLGYGSIGSGYYLDPLHAPLPFLWMAPRRFVTLVGEGWFSLDMDSLWSAPTWAMVLGVMLIATVLVAVLRKGLPGIDSAQRRTGGGLALGSAFALAPVLAVVPGPRLIGASVLGIAGVAALIIDATWFPAESADRTPDHGAARGRTSAWLTGLVALILAFSQLVHGPATAWLMGRRFKADSEGFGRQIASLSAQLHEPTAADVIVVRGSAGAFFAAFAAGDAGAPPWRFRVLAMTSHVLVLRQGPRTLDLIASHGQGLFPWGETNLFLSGRVLREGEVFDGSGMRVTIVEVANGLPRIARVEFDRELDAAGVLWLNETRTAYVGATPPAEGFGQPHDFNP